MLSIDKLADEKNIHIFVLFEENLRLNKFMFIQARMSSSRLPGKVLLPFRDSTVLQYLYRKCEDINGIDKVVILTSVESSDDEIERICDLEGMKVFRGDLLNVLKRYKSASRLLCEEEDYVIRLCADSPLIDSALIQSFTNAIRAEDKFFSTRKLVEGELQSFTGKGNNLDAFRVDYLLQLNELTEENREHLVYAVNYSKDSRTYETDLTFPTDLCIDTLSDYQRLS